MSLKRNNFRLQLFEDSTVEKDVDIRKKILKDYNKKEEEFFSLKEYNDYLEEIETIIYNLTHNVDYIETMKKIEHYKKENRESIIKNKMKYNKEILELDRLIEEERQHEIDKRESIEKQEIEIKRRKIIEKEALIEELMFSDNDAKEILNYFSENKNKKENILGINKQLKKDNSKKISYFSTGVRIGIGDSNQMYGKVLPKIEEGPLFVYVEPQLIVDGPSFPTWDNLEKMGYLRYTKQESIDENAGGFVSAYACMRALQEAMCGLYNISKKCDI